MAKLRSSAAYRIALANFAAFALGLALLGAIVFGAMHLAFTRQLDGEIRDEAQTLSDEYRTDGAGELKDSISQREAIQSPDRLLYAVFAADGRRLYGSLAAERPQVGLHDISFVDPKEGWDSGRAFAVDLSPNERLVVATDRDWVERIDRIVEVIFGAAFIAACLLGLLGAGVLGNYLHRRLQSISTAAEAIIGGSVRERMPVSAKHDEFDELAITLNRMLDRIEGLLNNLRQVSSDLAHDLRTPLARLRTRLEDGALAIGSDDAAAPVIEDSIRHVDEVLALFAAILRIAEVESGETRRFFATIDVSALVTELAESYAPAIADGERIMLWSVEAGLAVHGDRELLAQAASNLIENAQLHTPAGTMIRLTAIRSGERICIQVADNGPGVPRSEFGRIIRRFARLDTSRQKAGYGLGLNLVDAVAKLHQGRLILKEASPGLIAIIDMPALAAAARDGEASA